MSGIARDLPAYWQLARMWPQMAYAYRFNLLFWILSTVTQILLLRLVWTAVYAGRGPVEGVALDELVAYITLANLQLWITYPILSEIVQGRVREGLVAVDLARPLPYLGQLMAQQLGATAGLLPFLLLVMPLAYWAGSLRLPPSPEAGLLWGVSFALAYLIVSEIGMVLGLLAFWTMETWAFNAIFRFVNQFFAGGLVPLWLFPSWLALLTGLLPFQTQAHIPISLYLGRLVGLEAARGLATQLFWVAALYVLARWMWSRAVHKIVVQGG